MTYETPCRWFIQTADKQLWGYQRLAVLLIDLRINKGEPVTILERNEDGYKVHYIPITEQSLRSKEAS